MSKQKLLTFLIVLAIAMTIGTTLGIPDVNQHLAFAGQKVKWTEGTGGYTASHQGIGQYLKISDGQVVKTP
jgi:hypothetical protein